MGYRRLSQYAKLRSRGRIVPDLVRSHYAFRPEKNIMMHFVFATAFSILDLVKHLPLYGFGFVR